jgi:molybdenum cofactor cytidylyltransferase
MGTPKQLLLWDGVPMIRHVTRVFMLSRASEVIVMVGCRPSEVGAEALAGWIPDGHKPLTVSINPDWEHGEMLSSIKRGIQLSSPGVDGYLIGLADHPAVDGSSVDLLISASLECPPHLRGERVFVPTFRGRRGHPVLVGARLAQEILSLPPGGTLADVIRPHLVPESMVEVDSAGVLLDIDTLAEYEAAISPEGSDGRDD